MARFLTISNLAALVSRRGFASTTAATTRASNNAAEANITAALRGKADAGVSTETVWTRSWVPDPVTGYYRPANRVGESDPAELRQILLPRKSS